MPAKISKTDEAIFSQIQFDGRGTGCLVASSNFVSRAFSSPVRFCDNPFIETCFLPVVF